MTSTRLLGLDFHAAVRWTIVVAITTGVLLLFRDQLDKAHVALAYLLVVLLGSARTGRRAGIGLAILCFVCFNFFLLPPYHTLAISDSRDWLVLLAFLITSLVAAQLLYRAQHEAAAARERGEEINRLATLGAETLSAGRAEDATHAIARVIQATLDLGSCDIYDAGQDGAEFRRVGHAARPDHEPARDERIESMFDYAIENDAVIVRRLAGGVHVIANEADASRAPGLTQSDANVVVMPLHVRGAGVGILQLADDKAIQLNEPQLRFAAALAYYAALGVERVRLTAEAERAEALRAADRLKDALIAAVSHDLRTPLTTIKGLAHDLARGGDDRALTIEKQADRLNRLVADLLDLSRLRAGALELTPELNSAEDLVGAALAQISGLPRAADVYVAMPENVILGRFDFVHSLRALVNLIENALKHSPANSRVELSITRTNGQIAFSVLDRGEGIAHDELERIFEPFTRGRHVDPAIGGAGLGLSIAQGLATAQGGSVAHAPRPGGGSIFSLFLPAAHLPETES
ncbi:MAG: sensor histidine kinase [Gemmatimonadota bacterium]